ncbi:MAG: hypothetical protein WCJ92_07245 [Alphaproteobacteria bacterium]
MFSKILLGLAVSTAMVPATYSSYSSGAGGGPVNNHSSSSSAADHAHVGNAWSDIFPGIAPAAAPGPDYLIDQIVNKIQKHDWSGILNTWTARQLPQLNAEQLTRLAVRIREIYPNGIRFSEPAMITEQQYAGWNVATNQYILNPVQVIGDMPLAYIDLSIVIPFGYDRIDEIIGSNFDHAIMEGAKRNTPVAAGVSLGQAWSVLNEFIEHYRLGLNEAEALLASAQLSPQEKAGLEKLIEGSSQLFNRLAELHSQINAEFEKPNRSRNMQLVERAMQEFMALLRGEAMAKFRNGIEPDIMHIMRFVFDQPALAKLKVMQTFKNAGSVPAVKTKETTAQMLDRLLAVPGRANEIAQAMAAGGHEGLLLTLRLDNRLWNVSQLNTPVRQMDEMDWEMPNAVRQQIQGAATRMHLAQGSHVIVVRQPAADRHVYQVVRLQWNQWNYADNFTIVGEFEIREAKEGDRTELYNPLRTHGRNSIQGTMMEQRVHGVMAAHRVHAFGALPEDVRHGLRSEIDRYADERDYTRMENQGLSREMLTREEHSPASEADAKIVAKNRAAKVSSELKQRLIGSRVARLRTHGDDLTENPAEFMQMRVHTLFDPERLHTTHGLSERERQFFGDNLEGGYLDTVENAIAARQVPLAEPDSVHYDAERMHQRIHELAPYNVASGYGRSDDHSSASGLAAPTQSYDHLGHALADYDMQ